MHLDCIFRDVMFASGKGVCILYLEYPSQASSGHFSCCFSKLVVFNSVVKSPGSLKKIMVGFSGILIWLS